MHVFGLAGGQSNQREPVRGQGKHKSEGGGGYSATSLLWGESANHCYFRLHMTWGMPSLSGGGKLKLQKVWRQKSKRLWKDRLQKKGKKKCEKYSWEEKQPIVIELQR